ncbi:uncharacterized protein [Typha angustifolia]|uniref:uncharacterized protein n=1 Tax=Typha angustifolia TaxID=59011 RepID=UPI003C3070B7
MACTTTAGAGAKPLYVLLLLLSLSLPRSLADKEFLDFTCSKIRHPRDCVSVLQSDPRSFAVDNVAGLMNIAFDITMAGADATLSNIDKLAKQHPGLSEETALSQCWTLYTKAIDDLKEAKAETSKKMLNDAALDLIASARKASRKCEEMFKKLNVASPLSQENRMMWKRCGVCYGLVFLQSID